MQTARQDAQRGGSALGTRPRTDDLQSAHDPNDDEFVRAVHDRAKQRAGPVEPPEFLPLAPLRPDEVICRSCHLAVRRRDPEGVTLLICNDCRW